MNANGPKRRYRAAGLSLLLTLLMLMPAACTPGEAALSLAGTTWQPVSMGIPPEMNRLGVQHLTFGRDGQVTGRLGWTNCDNDYYASYSARGRGIRFKDIERTPKGCRDYQPGGEGDQYILALHEARSFEVTADSLIIYYKGGGEIHFVPPGRREPPPPP